MTLLGASLRVVPWARIIEVQYIRMIELANEISGTYDLRQKLTLIRELRELLEAETVRLESKIISNDGHSRPQL